MEVGTHTIDEEGPERIRGLLSPLLDSGLTHRIEDGGHLILREEVRQHP